jgi:hypothetical protein
MKIKTLVLFALSFLVLSAALSSPAEAQNQHIFSTAASGSQQFALTHFSYYGAQWHSEDTFSGAGIVPDGGKITSFLAGGNMYLAWFNIQSNGTQPESLHIVSTPLNTIGGWGAITNLYSIGAPTPDIHSGLFGYAGVNGEPTIWYIAEANGQGLQTIVQVALISGTWHVVIGAGGGIFGEAASAGTPIVGYVYNTSPTAWYIGADQHIHKVFYNLQTDQWATDDVTAESAAPDPVSGSSLLGYQFGGNADIWFIVNDEHIHQSWWSGSKWFSADTTKTANAPIPEFGTAMAGYMFTGDPVIYYMSTDQHIHEMSWNGSSWIKGDITISAGGETPISGSPLVGYALSGKATVFYVTESGTASLRESFWNGTSWQDVEVSPFICCLTSATLSATLF